MRITHFLAMVSCGLMLTLSMEGIAAPATQSDSSQLIVLAQAGGDASYGKSSSKSRHHVRHNKKRKSASKKARSQRARHANSGMDAQSAE
ncbi:MAG: hypothetical protein HQL58_02360 [Magnetococcales bacterium]|nr:hypothetical protein [Magnetococcales bacterium]